MACETFRPHIDTPCMNCGETALRHVKRKDKPSMQKEVCEKYEGEGNIANENYWGHCSKCGHSWAAHWELKQKEKTEEETTKGEVRIGLRYVYLLNLLDRLKEETRHMSPTSVIHIYFEDGEWRATLTFKDRRRDGGVSNQTNKRI